jgi:1,4-alpha-glucan branching enzyme
VVAFLPVDPKIMPIAAHDRRRGHDGSVAVTFTVDARDGVEAIALVGDFNDWSATTHPMSRVNHRFSTTVRLRPGCRHRYQFLVDGEQRENDWAADDYEEVSDGAYVSVIDLGRCHR